MDCYFELKSYFYLYLSPITPEKFSVRVKRRHAITPHPTRRAVSAKRKLKEYFCYDKKKKREKQKNKNFHYRLHVTVTSYNNPHAFNGRSLVSYSFDRFGKNFHKQLNFPCETSRMLKIFQFSTEIRPAKTLEISEHTKNRFDLYTEEKT